MDYQKLFYISGTVFFVCATVLALAMIIMMFAGPFFDQNQKSDFNEKYPGGIEAQKKLLEKEGHKVIQKGKKYLVVDFAKSLAKL